MKKLLFICCFCIFSLYSFGIVTPPDNTIPFRMLGHLIMVKVKINESDTEYNFVIDTGGLTFIDKNIADVLKLKQRGTMAKVNKLDLNGFRIENVFCFTTFDFKHLDALSTPVHGIIGSNLLERFKVTFDFKSSLVTFSGDTVSLERPEKGLYLTFRNHPVNNAPIIKFKTGEKSFDGMIDTGQPYPVVFPLDYFEEFKNLFISDFIRSEGLMEEWPMTNANFNYLARLKCFEFEGLKINNLICLFGELPRMLSMPLIGNEFLSQFKIIINYPRDEMLLIPYENPEFKENRFSIGLNPDISKENEVIVKGVWENSPADNADIKAGDTILSFNSRKASQSNLIDLLNMINDDTVKSISLEVKSQNKSRKIDLNKVMLF